MAIQPAPFSGMRPLKQAAKGQEEIIRIWESIKLGESWFYPAFWPPSWAVIQRGDTELGEV